LIIVDHHLEMIKSADYLVELGPKGGSEGGYLLYQGRPKDIVRSKKSITKTYI